MYSSAKFACNTRVATSQYAEIRVPRAASFMMIQDVCYGSMSSRLRWQSSV